MNFDITDFQLRVLVLIHKDQKGTTYELSKKLKKDFWRVQQACRGLWWKGYVSNDKGRWYILEAAQTSEEMMETLTTNS